MGQPVGVQLPPLAPGEFMNRYSRQIRFAPLGPQGQKKLQESSAAIVGCGALGSTIAEILSRAGIGKLILIDRDLLEESNLQRQFLYDMENVREGLPKVEAAKRRIAEINPEVHVQAENTSLTEQNAESLLGSVNVILDGTDNFSARYLINDFAVRSGIPWIYGAAVGSYGLTMTILPRESACLRCVFPDPPAEKDSPNCETAGVLGSITATIGAIEASEAMQILSGNRKDVSRELLSIDLWPRSFHSLHPQKRDDCQTCGSNAVQSPKSSISMNNSSLQAESLCGRNAVQIVASEAKPCNLENEAARLQSQTEIVSKNKFLLRFRWQGQEASLFPDGRLIVWETSDVESAKVFYQRFFP